MQLDRKEKIVAFAAVGLVMYTLALATLGSTVYSVLTNKTVSNVGSIKAIGVGVYSDQACTSRVSSINWGVLDLGSNTNQTVYIRNEGNSAGSLAEVTSNWNPANASSYITWNWNYGGQTLDVNQVIQVKFTLSVSPSITGITSFSFDAIITASG